MAADYGRTDGGRPTEAPQYGKNLACGNRSTNKKEFRTEMA